MPRSGFRWIRSGWSAPAGCGQIHGTAECGWPDGYIRATAQQVEQPHTKMAAKRSLMISSACKRSRTTRRWYSDRTDECHFRRLHWLSVRFDFAVTIQQRINFSLRKNTMPMSLSQNKSGIQHVGDILFRCPATSGVESVVLISAISFFCLLLSPVRQHPDAKTVTANGTDFRQILTQPRAGSFIFQSRVMPI